MNRGRNTTEQDRLERTLEAIADGEEGYELVFHPATGQIVAVEDVGDEDRLPATQMARDGFFVGDPPAGQTAPAAAPLLRTDDVFSRNAAVLETDALAAKRALVVGVGSGGAVVADSLARSGVGGFTLWDHDRLNVHNVGRHICTLDDVGRPKVDAMRDRILAINPAADVECIHRDVTTAGDDLDAAVERVDCVVAGTDNNASRFAINAAAIQASKPAYFGRAYTRACGGDVIQVLPGRDAPCYACHAEGHIVNEEVSSARDAERTAYADKPVPIEPGLAIDIWPIANMIARLVVLRLCAGTASTLVETAGELDAPLYLWANRRQENFVDWPANGARSRKEMAILRWYAVGVPKNPECMSCA